MFELLEPTAALLTSVTNRVERHGDDEVPAISLGVKITAANTILDLLSPTLRPTLYTRAEGQDELPGVEETTPLLRTNGIEHLVFRGEMEGATLDIANGIADDSAICIRGCTVDHFKVAPKEGGTVDLSFRVSSSEISVQHAGLLWAKNHQEVDIMLTAPKLDEPAIDGTVAAYEAEHPQQDDTTDAFLLTQQAMRRAGAQP